MTASGQHISRPARSAADLGGAPWRRVPFAALGAAGAVPTMLSRSEQRLYFWLTSTRSADAGAVVDLGCFAGGSTACLAEGLLQSGHDESVVAFDRFRVSERLKEKMLYPAGVAPFEGDALLPVARRFLAPWAGRIAFRPGEIETATWDAGPIEILTVDAAKSASVADRIAEIFYPHLVPGRSVVVHQDYLHWKVPWVAAQMERLARYFLPVAHCPRDTVVFLCTERPDPAALREASLAGLDDAAMARAITAAAARLAQFGVGERVSQLREVVASNPGIRRARDMKVRP